MQGAVAFRWEFFVYIKWLPRGGASEWVIYIRVQRWCGRKNGGTRVASLQTMSSARKGRGRSVQRSSNKEHAQRERAGGNTESDRRRRRSWEWDPTQTTSPCE